MMGKSDTNARKALDEMKLEIANELNIRVTHAGMVGGTMTKRLVEMGQRQLIKESKPDVPDPN